MNDFRDLKAIAEACQQHQPLRFMPSHGALYIRNDNGIVFDVHQNRSFPEFMAQNKDYADLVLAANPATVLALIAENERLQSAARTLERLCYTDNGGELWKPPIGKKPDFALMDQLKTENEALRESNDKLTRRNGMLEQNVEIMTETHILYTWLRKKCDQPNNDVVAVHMNIGHDWATVHDLDTDLRAMIEREEP
ncbi:hypothetical protein D3C71_834300 [compost metagenome]